MQRNRIVHRGRTGGRKVISYTVRDRGSDRQTATIFKYLVGVG